LVICPDAGDGGIGATPQDRRLPGFTFNVEEWFEGDRYETLAICRTLEPARAGVGGGRRSFRGHHRCQQYYYFA
jgi:hypothetical protein